jgi:calcineurin-like phosphoesterase family protein
MMVNIYVISDTHFGHENSLKWLDSEGNKLRPFDTVEELNNTMITNWNNTVKPEDHVYHLGDVVIKKEHLELVKQLNGHKRLCKGNHDQQTLKEYIAVGFQEIYGVRVFPGLKCILSHIPIHPECLKEDWINVSGHLHSNNLSDRRYINVSVEQINYTPVLLEDILKQRRNENIN